VSSDNCAKKSPSLHFVCILEVFFRIYISGVLLHRGGFPANLCLVEVTGGILTVVVGPRTVLGCYGGVKCIG